MQIKKSLSLLLVLTIIISMFSALPAFAVNVENTGDYAEEPGEKIGDNSLTQDNLELNQQVGDKISETGEGIQVLVSSNLNTSSSWYSDEQSTFTITTAAQLAEFAALINSGMDFSGKTVTLGNSIGLSEVGNWTPIGTAIAEVNVVSNADIYTVTAESKPFNGIFDGGGYEISGMSISATTGGQALFGYLGSGGRIENLTVRGSVTIAASGEIDYFAGVVAYSRGTISDVVSYVDVQATGTAYSVGGIAGRNDGYPDGAAGRIYGCANYGSVTGYNKVGGIAGSNAGSVESCYNSGTISNTNTASKAGVGGIVGRNGNTYDAVETGTVKYCYNTGAITTIAKWTGGIVGFNNALSSVTNCYVIDGPAGGNTNNPVIGLNEGITASNYSLSSLGASTDALDSEKGERLTSSDMKAQTFLNNLNAGGRGFCFVSGVNGGYPVLLAFHPDGAYATKLTVISEPRLEYRPGEYFDVSSFYVYAVYSDGSNAQATDITPSITGPLTEADTQIKLTVRHDGLTQEYTYTITVTDDGTPLLNKNGYYEIRTAAHMYWFAAQVNSGQVSINGILMNYIDLPEKLNEQPWLGISKFTSTTRYKGTFDGGGYSVNLNVTENLATVDKDAHQTLFGYINGATIKNLIRTGSTTGLTQNAIGGIVGVAIGGSVIENCVNHSTVSSSNNYVGGIVGQAGSTGGGVTVRNCLNTGAITGISTGGNGTGGIVGGTNGAAVTISNCANTGAISGIASYTGGITGRLNNASNVLTYCYNTGEVSSTHASAYAGGIAGYTAANATVKNTYSIGTVSGNNSAAIIGSCAGTTNVIGNYYLDTLTTDSNAAPKSAEEMKTSDFLALFNGATRSFMIASGLNEGYPVLRSLYPDSDTSTVQSLTISGDPSLSYVAGQAFDTSALCVTANYSDDTTADVTNLAVLQLSGNGDDLAAGDTSVTVTASFGGQTGTKTYAISVTANSLSDITIANLPTNLTYAVGESFDSTGMTVKASYSNGNIATLHASAYTWSPVTFSGSETDVTVSYTEGGVTKRVQVNVTVLADTVPDLTGGAYQLGCVSDMLWFANQVNVLGKSDLNAAVTANVDFSSAIWTPIGTNINLYSGSFDGGLNTITFNHNANTSYQGLFGYLGSGASVSNVVIAGTITSTSTYVGAIAGYTRAGVTITNCLNKASISGTNYIGGIVGYSSAVITLCGNEGSVTATANGAYVGGIAAYASFSGSLTMVIDYCYNTGAVSATGASGTPNAGGIAGYNNGSNTITNSYNSGAVSATSATKTNVAAIAGWAHTTNINNISNVYYLSDLDPFGNSVTADPEKAVAKSSDNLKNASILSLLNGENNRHFFIFLGANGGYPVLRSLYPGDDFTVANGVAFEVAADTLRTEYVTGQYLDLTGITAIAEYSDGTKETLTGLTATPSGPLVTSDTEAVITAVCGLITETYSYNISVESSELASLSASALRTVFAAGEVFEQDELTVTATYTNGLSAILSNAEYELILPEPFASGDAVIKYTYDGKTLSETIAITVLDSAVPATSSAGAYVLQSAGDVLWFAQQVNIGAQNQDAILANDIDLSGVGFVAIGSAEHPYMGSFDGNNRTLAVSINSGGKYVGVFERAVGASINMLDVTGSVSGTSTDCLYVGGIVGYGTSISIVDCENYANVSSLDGHVGGIIGFVSVGGTNEIIKCANHGTISGTATNAGGIVGLTQGSVSVSSAILSVDRCYNDADINVSASYAGGIAGNAYGISTSISITNCYNTGDITGNGSVGGIAGYTTTNAYTGAAVTVKNSYNIGSLSGDNYVGSIIGCAAKIDANITNNYYIDTGTAGIGQTQYGTVTAATTIKKTVNELKEASILAALGNASFTFDGQNNSGYPILAWQTTADTYTIMINTAPGGATVELFSDSERTSPVASSTPGIYSVTANKYYYTVSAGGYVSSMGEITVPIITYLEVTLAKAVTASFTVTPANASLSVMSVETGDFVTPKSSNNGTYTFELASDSQYEYTAIRAGYTSKVGVITASNGLIEKISLSEIVSGGNIRYIYGDGNAAQTHTISAGGSYVVGAGATGVLTIETSEPVTLVGTGISAADMFNDLTIKYTVSGASLNLQDLFIKNNVNSGSTSSQVVPGFSVIDFMGTGNWLSFTGVSLLESQEYVSNALIHVPHDGSLNINGSGTLYLYKYSQGSGIGGNAEEVCGAITIASGSIFAKGSKTGALIGGDSTNEKTVNGDITISGGNINLITIGQGAAIGASRTGTCSGNVYITGGNVTIVSDYSGSAIGYGGQKKGDPGLLYVTGGSLKAVRTNNSLLGNSDSSTQIVDDSLITADKGNLVLLVLDRSYTNGKSVSVSGYGTVYPDNDYIFTESTSSTIANWTYRDDDSVYLYLDTTKTYNITASAMSYSVEWDGSQWLLTDKEGNVTVGGSGGTTTSPETPSIEIESETTVKGGTATTTVTGDAVTGSIEKAKEEHSGTLTIKSNADGADVSKSIVEIPKNSAREIADADMKLKVETGNGTLTFTSATLLQISGKTGGTLGISFEQNSDGSHTISISVDDVIIEEFAGVTLASIPASSGQVVVIINSDGIQKIVKKSIVENGTAYLVLSGSVTVMVIDNPKKFGDVNPDDWFYADAMLAAIHELFQGVSDTEFSPDEPMTRAMMVTVLYRLENEPNTSIADLFNDMESETWYTDAVAWATEGALVTGYDENTFGPEDPVTREQLATLIYRYAKYAGMGASESDDLSTFTDSGTVSDWATDAIKWSVGVGLVKGMGDGTIAPQDAATRAEGATILMRLVTLMVK